MNTKYNKLFVLLIAGLTLAVICTGNAFAYTWSGTDGSNCGGSSASWTSSVNVPNPPPHVSTSTSLTWQNSFTNSYTGGLYAKIIGSYGMGSGSYDSGAHYISSGSQPWKPDGSMSPNGAWSWNCLYVYHEYGTTSSCNIVTQPPIYVQQDYSSG
jgi:hypothetical protein